MRNYVPFYPLSFTERNFREAKRLKEERELLTKEGVKNQTQLESMLEELTDNKKLLEKARRKGEAWELQINEQERSSGIDQHIYIYIYIYIELGY